ncbi:hypothetical protein RSAG8_04380, partial [Rhizoctonia solani AG-8 WAC10335]
MDYDSLFSIDISETDTGTMKGRTQRKRDASRPPPKSLMGLFEVPAAPAPTPDSPPHVEVRGVKVGKGRVRERVREFEARAEEHSSIANLSYGSISSVSARHPELVAPSVGRAVGKEANAEKDTYFQDREHALSLGRSASVPLLVESPNRLTKTRPKSEHLLRRISQEDAASISMINAANSDLSDLISRLDLSASPDSKYQLSPPVCRAPPAFVQGSPSKRGPRNLEDQQSLTALVGYNHSPVARTPSVEELDVEIKHVLYKGKTSRASVILLDLSASPDSKYQLSPPVCRAPPAFVQGSPSKRGPRNLEDQQSLTALVGYNHSLVARTPSVEELDVEIKHVLYKGKTSRASVFTFSPDSTEPKSTTGSTPSYQHPATHTSPDFEQDTPRERSSGASMKARRRGTYGAPIEDSVRVDNDEDHSDIPDELQAILTSQSEDESSPILSSSSSLPLESRVTRQNSKVQFELPEEYHEEPQTDNEEVTFDFTGELGQLKGGSRNSFVEALVSAFKTPALPVVVPFGPFSAFKTPALPVVGEGQLQLNIESPIRPLQSSEEGNHGTMYSSGGRTPTSSQIPKVAVEHPSEDARPDYVAKVSGRLPAARVSGTFDYDTLMRELDEVSSAVEGSTQDLERSANRRRLHRLSTDSDRSSLFRGGRGQRRDEPTTTFSFAAPPVSFHNRPYSRQIAHSIENDNTGRLSWTGELPGRDNDDSERFARPGLGDKMFQMGTEHGLPLPSIMASPANSDGSAGQQAAYEDYTSGGYSYAPDRRSSYAPSLADQKRMSFMSYDSYLEKRMSFMSYDSYLEVPGNGNARRSSVDADSLFERRGRPSSISSVSVFGDDRRRRRSRAMFNPNYRPVSIISMQSETTGEDDTMVSMIGGADNSRVPRKSIATNLLLDTSPCMRAEKRAKEMARVQHIEANRAASLGHSNADSSVSDSVVIINPDAQMAEMIEMIGAGYVFSNEQLEAVTRYCALRNEAVETVTRSQKIWQDTDFSRFALSAFIPPTNSADIKAMIDHSQSTYSEIPAEVYRRPRPRHPRSSARASPYHVSRNSFKSTMSPHTRLATESIEHALALLPPTYDLVSRSPRPVPESPYPSHTAMGLLSPGPGARAISTMAPLSPLVVNVQPATSIEEKLSKPGLRSRTGSGTRAALGWGKKPSTGSINGKAPATQASAPTTAKENEAAGTISNTNHNLRLNRPRPKGRVASGTARPSTLRV